MRGVADVTRDVWAAVTALAGGDRMVASDVIHDAKLRGEVPELASTTLMVASALALRIADAEGTTADRVLADIGCRLAAFECDSPPLERGDAR